MIGYDVVKATGDVKAVNTAAARVEVKQDNKPASVAQPKKKYGEEQQQERSMKELMIKRVGAEEHSAISQVLTLQQEQFAKQVQELHSISQRQWQHVSRTLFPYLESFRPALSSPSAASTLFNSQEQQRAAVSAMNQAVSAMNMQPNWWHDPMKVMGIQHMPSLVHASQSGSQMQPSSQMESTMIGSHHPSLFSGGQGGSNQERETNNDSRQRMHASSSGRHESSVNVEGGKAVAQGGGAGVKRQQQSQDQSKRSHKRQKEGQGHQHSLASKSNRGGFEASQEKGPVSCPTPKVATPQSAIDILLALSEATSTENQASQLRAQSNNHSQTQLAGTSERISAFNENKGSKKQQQ